MSEPAGNRLWVWDKSTSRFIGQPLVHPQGLVAVHFSSETNRLATACRDRAVRVWEWPGGQLASPALPHPAPVIMVRLSPDGLNLATAAEDNIARLWRLNISAEPFSFPHQNTIISIHFDQFSQQLITVDKTGCLQIWDVQTGRQLLVFRASDKIVPSPIPSIFSG